MSAIIPAHIEAVLARVASGEATAEDAAALRSTISGRHAEQILATVLTTQAQAQAEQMQAIADGLQGLRRTITGSVVLVALVAMVLLSGVVIQSVRLEAAGVQLTTLQTTPAQE